MKPHKTWCPGNIEEVPMWTFVYHIKKLLMKAGKYRKFEENKPERCLLDSPVWKEIEQKILPLSWRRLLGGGGFKLMITWREETMEEDGKNLAALLEFKTRLWSVNNDM